MSCTVKVTSTLIKRPVSLLNLSRQTLSAMATVSRHFSPPSCLGQLRPSSGARLTLSPRSPLATGQRSRQCYDLRRVQTRHRVQFKSSPAGVG